MLESSEQDMEGIVPSLDEKLGEDNLSISVDHAYAGPLSTHDGSNLIYFYAKEEIPLVVLRELMMGYLQEQRGLDVEFSEDSGLVAMASSLISCQTTTGVVHLKGRLSREGLAFAVCARENSMGRIKGRRHQGGNEIKFYALRGDMLEHMMIAYASLRNRFNLGCPIEI